MNKKQDILDKVNKYFKIKYYIITFIAKMLNIKIIPDFPFVYGAKGRYYDVKNGKFIKK